MSQSHESWQVCDSCSIVEYLRCHAVSLALVDPSALGACCNPAGILSAVLEKVEGFVEVDGSGIRVGICQDEG